MSETIYNNRYRLDAKVGEGGMAVVYRGYDLLLHRQVAIKVLREQYAADEGFVQRFYREAQSAAKLSHPNIVNTYDVGTSDGAPYIVQEFVTGETLTTLIARERHLPEAAAVRYARQICAALAAAHRHELLHRDIKPSNVIITQDDVVRVTDFGIARAVSAQTITSADDILASVPYCSPEQLMGENLSEASDLYSVGVVLFEMVTGHRPFEADSAVGVAMAHLNAPVPDPNAGGPTVSPALRAVIRRLLQKAPADRFHSAGEVLAALRQCVEEDEAPKVTIAGPDTPTAILRRRALLSEKLAAASGAGERERVAVWRPSRAVGIAAAALLALVVVAFIVARQQAASIDLRVPDLTGKTVTDAISSLHALGIDQVNIQQRNDPSMQAGLIAGTEPAANSVVQRGQPLTLWMSNGPQLVQVPDVVGQDLRFASDFLVAKGFTVKVDPGVHSSVKQGGVARTNPAAGSKVPGHGVVTLIPSLGPQLTLVPNVVALAEDDARKILTGAGLKLKVNQVVQSANIPPNTVIDQDPSEGATVKPGSTIVVDVSGNAPTPATISVPDVTGGTVDDARQTLAAAGLSVGKVSQAFLPDTTPGTVVSQNPPPGAQVARGAIVDLVIAAQPGAQPQPTQSGAPSPPPPTP